jgi:hypothetical protein
VSRKVWALLDQAYRSGSMRVKMCLMNEATGKWCSYGPGGPSNDLPEDVRPELLRRKAERDERRGRAGGSRRLAVNPPGPGTMNAKPVCVVE